MTILERAVPGLRGRLLLSVVGAITIVLAALTVGFNLVLGARLESDAAGVVQARAAAEVASLRISHGRVLLPEAPDERNPETQIWVFEGNRAIEAPRSAEANGAAAAMLAAGAPATRDVTATQTRLYALPLVQSGRRAGAVVAAVSLVPYEQTRRTALLESAVLALVVLITVALAARWLIDRALRPVAQMTRQASEWSEHDLDRRFSLGPATDELTQLGHTLDGLLERLAASLRHEQRLSAEISHELRTPLANLIAEAQYGLRHTHTSDDTKATLERILASARQLATTLETLMAAARAGLDPQGATSDARACAHAALRAGSVNGFSQALELTVNAPPEPVRVSVERDLVERILAPLVENAVRYAEHAVEVSVARDGDAVLFTVQDDGPGVPEDEREEIFQPGRRAAGSVASLTGAGLGLALCRRLARTARGDVRAEPSDAGARFTVRLPAA